MSEFRSVRDALWASPIPTTAKIVALRLVEHLPCVRPSIAGIAECTGLSERAVQYALRELERNGVIVAEQRMGQPSIYRFRGMGPIEVFPWGRTTCTPAPDAPGGEPTAPPGGAPLAPEADNSQADKISGGRKRPWRIVPDDWVPKEQHRAKVKHWTQSRFESVLQDFRDWEFKEPKTDPDKAFFRWLKKEEAGTYSSFPKQTGLSEWQRKQDDGTYAKSVRDL